MLLLVMMKREAPHVSEPQMLMMYGFEASIPSQIIGVRGMEIASQYRSAGQMLLRVHTQYLKAFMAPFVQSARSFFPVGGCKLKVNCFPTRYQISVIRATTFLATLANTSVPFV